MVERYVFVKLKDDFADDKGRAEIAARTLRDLENIPGTRRIIVGTPDDDAKDSWDLSIVVVFDSHDAVAPYLAHPEHRRYVDEYLKEKIEVIKYWNFFVEVRDTNSLT